MFHSSTTLWQHANPSPLAIAENRRIFAFNPKQAVGNFYKGVGSFGRGFVDTVGAIIAPISKPLSILMLPITGPTRVGLWGIKKGYYWVIKPATKAASVTAGTLVEMGKGLREAIWDPAFTYAKAPVWNLKMNLLDLPIHLLSSAVHLPIEILRTPGRILSEIKKTTLEFPGKMMGVASNTRKNVEEVLTNVGELKPIKALVSMAKTGRDLLRGVFVDPVVSGFKHTWAPLGPLLDGPVGGVEIIAKSKWQYVTSVKKAAGQFRDGIERIIKAPGKELDVQGIKAWWKEVSPEKMEEAPEGPKTDQPGNGHEPKPGNKGKRGKGGTPTEPENND